MPVSYPQSFNWFGLKLCSQWDHELPCQCRGDVPTLAWPGDLTLGPRKSKFTHKTWYLILGRCAKNGGIVRLSTKTAAIRNSYNGILHFIMCFAINFINAQENLFSQSSEHFKNCQRSCQIQDPGPQDLAWIQNDFPRLFDSWKIVLRVA